MSSNLAQYAATVCLVWSVVVVVVEAVGIRAIFRHFSRLPTPPVSSRASNHDNVPRITLIRPVKGLEPHLYECIASSFQQDYPVSRVSIRLCVESKDDPAYSLLCRIVENNPGYDAKVLVEEEDPLLHGSGGLAGRMGPNPKIRNISRAYREAGKEDLIWIIDSNVWISKNIMGRMVDKLMGYSATGKGTNMPYIFAHQLPLVVDVGRSAVPSATDSSSLQPSTEPPSGALARMWTYGGGRLDEMFMATTHAKFYSAINEVGVAPCVVGKSNMFRKAHLDLATSTSSSSSLLGEEAPLTGIDYFSHHICEDHIIGELLWRTNIPNHLRHGIVWGDLVFQPMADMSVAAYAARRARWLRARKFTVLAATLVEPGVESFLCCAYFAFAITTLPWFHETFGISQTWSAMALTWLVSVFSWMAVDWFTFQRLHAGYTVEQYDGVPYFARGTAYAGGIPRRSYLQWCLAWLGREALALPIWIYAVLLGADVVWRGKTFRVKFDTTVEEMPRNQRPRESPSPEWRRSRPSSKDRQD
ncbi:hypothetical protein S7711_06975 [Stachybotrys chartarum IBT 7711]|uniref:Ceramide glucosyltransferase n=1 Tax=Stachybotrys chartarum (strain CBS 109288 / IBT 7711) TaxID=1280523 RepID=A0A084ARY6_STACB|nr:hypothetical protein S7711_06975 [Stachybotrys chartarum IBT 7711]KFA46475.1 hypothetical protein S40293_04241 [Stachybotrys chartarum IBT 40293]